MAEPAKDRHKIMPYSLRMPDELRDKLEAEAQADGRSLHAHILWILEKHLSGAGAEQPTLTKEEVQTWINKLIRATAKEMLAGYNSETDMLMRKVLSRREQLEAVKEKVEKAQATRKPARRKG